MRVGALPEPNFDHLQHMTSAIGLWEHARFSTPRVEHGYCTDDNARALILLDRERSVSPELFEMYRTYLRFLQDSTSSDGGFHNRRRADGSWADTKGSDDSQGRAIWALGSVARFGSESWMRSVGVELFRHHGFESPSPRANAFAVLGAVELLGAEPADELVRGAIEDWVVHLRIAEDPEWPWPEKRLAYDNPRIPEALMAAGDALGIDQMVEDGLHLLEWLISKETRDGVFSFTPVGGWAAGEKRPGFDQQPVEAAAFADACARAWHITGENKWSDHVLRAARWFMGDNDRRIVMYNSDTGGCYDGLTPTGPNLNQGAESTMAALTTLQQAAKFS